MSWKNIGIWYKSFVQMLNIGQGFTITPKNYTNGVSWELPKVFSSTSNIIYKIFGVVHNKVTKTTSETFKIDKYTTNLERQSQLYAIRNGAITGAGITTVVLQTPKFQINVFHPIVRVMIWINNNVAYSRWWGDYSPSYERDLLPYTIKIFKEGQPNNPILTISDALVWDSREDKQYANGKSRITFKMVELKNLDIGIYEIKTEFNHNLSITNPTEQAIIRVNCWQLNYHIVLDNLWYGNNTYYSNNIIYAYDDVGNT